jgi:glycosyltransferase involved in cell wall biosynthesis
MAYWKKTGWRNFGSLPLADFYWGWKLFRASRQFDAVFTTSERASRIFALLQLTRPRRVPHIQMEFFLEFPRSRRLRALKLALFRLEQRSVTKIVLFSSAQTERYRKVLGFAADKFVAIPFHTTIHAAGDEVIEPGNGDYIFAGGNTGRDYNTLVKAARKVPARFLIATNDRAQFEKMGGAPPNVDIVTAEPKTFLRLMARSAMVVVPLQKELLRSCGHQTYLNAMAFGKAVVAADNCGADEYIEQGSSGMVVAPGDAVQLADSLNSLMSDPARRERMGHAARARAEQFSAELFFRRVLDLIPDKDRGGAARIR